MGKRPDIAERVMSCYICHNMGLCIVYDCVLLWYVDNGHQKRDS